MFKNGKLRVIGPIGVWDDVYQAQIALAVENGEIIIGTQHGCNYGTAQFFSFAGEIEYDYQSFITWGWEKHDPYSVHSIPLPSPLLTRFQNKPKYKSKKNKLLLIGTRDYLFNYRLNSEPPPLDSVKWRAENESFLNSLNSKVFCKIAYAPYPNDHGALKNTNYFKSLFPDLEILDENLNSAMFKYSVLVIDHPGTTFNIAMAANIPIIGFWNPKVWGVCKQAKSDFNELEKVGIIYRNGEQAAAKIMSIGHDINQYWASQPIQTARKAWCWKYARTDKNWSWEWVKLLWSL
jgi:putative transferase (TIGR04331 family)